jgi:6,7-dimethyl-8-ribityllumazine synthase
VKNNRFNRKFVKPAVVASRYNLPIVEKLVEGAKQGFTENGVPEDEIEIFWVPGAFEIPLMAKTLAQTKRYDCIVCVGCVLKGETFHFEHVANAVSTGIQAVSLATGVPVIFSVILSDDPQKAWERAQGKTNRGYEGALTGLEMAKTLQAVLSISRKKHPAKE